MTIMKFESFLQRVFKATGMTSQTQLADALKFQNEIRAEHQSALEKIRALEERLAQ